MESERPHLSITLPRNFMFHYRDGAAPQTPEPEPQIAELQPPPPPRQTLKVRRRRATLVQHQIELDFPMEEKPIPTIEATDYFESTNYALPSPPSALDNAYLSPPTSFSRGVSPPKTPAHQVRTIDVFAGPQHWDDLESSRSETSSRPTSSSGFSDSSISSRGSMESFVSRGGSCTSPEEEMCDPFSFDALEMKYKQPSSPLAAHQQLRPTNKLKLRATFTEEMDYHLWRTYMTYLQDPTVTPFKAVPLTTPPNGVCHRVARMARKTWKGPVSARTTGIRSATQTRSGTPNTIKALKSGSSTPIARPSKSYLRYPTEKQCRKRLRDLAKQRPSLSAYYQRLLHRSPSPLQSSPPSEKAEEPAQPQPQPQQTLSSPFSEDNSSFTFSTRDMNVSLATSTAASMQMGNPLSQLAKDLTPRPEQKSWSRARSSAHQKSQSLHVGLGLGLSNVLGSPFQSSSTVEMTDAGSNSHNAQTWHAQTGLPTPRLGSPFQLHAPRPKSRVFKRRALANSFEDKSRNRGNSFVDDIFGAPAESSHRRVRDRGFSLGDMMDGAGVRRLPLSSSGPSEFNPFANLRPQLPSPVHTSPAIMTEAHGQGTIRLGTPFGGRPSNTFPRASTSYGFEPPASFEQRFAAAPSNSER